MIENYFSRIAIAARARGFAVTPLRDKRPFLPAWNRHPLTTETEIMTAAKEYPTCDVGLVMKRNIGEPFAIDIDVPGVVERLERETGQELPQTYTVLSRPVTAPHKRHIFLRHTQYSNSVFAKNVNAGEYDLIGTGTRALQVVSEGCVRPETGEVRTGNGLPIADCPDWLADWLVADSRRLLTLKSAEARSKNAERQQKKKEVAEILSAERRVETGYDHHGREERYRFIRSRVRTLSNAGMAKDRILPEILAQYKENYGDIKDDDPNGWPVQELKRKIRSVINNPDLKQGNPPPIRPITTGLVIKAPPESDWERRLKVARQLPKTIPTKQVYERLGLDSNKPAEKRAVSRVMKAAGFVARRGRRGAVWTKVGEARSREGYIPPLSPFHIIRVVSLSLLTVQSKRISICCEVRWHGPLASLGSEGHLSYDQESRTRQQAIQGGKNVLESKKHHRPFGQAVGTTANSRTKETSFRDYQTHRR
jgi:bifunctional DNA primase/polymerase-like protein